MGKFRGPHHPSDSPFEFWEARYSEPGWAYGSEPNDFVRAMADRLPPGRVLCLAEGQGRNAVYLATRGFDVTAMDQSPTGLAVAQHLAAARGVKLTTVVANLDTFAIEPGAFTGIVSVFVHVPAPLRRSVHERVVRGLAPGGAFVLEAYAPAQANLKSGGPKEPELLVSLEQVRDELRGLDLELAAEGPRDVTEGRYHKGLAHTVQVLARRPAS
jgi:SAM-dependent methyltransferase